MKIILFIVLLMSIGLITGAATGETLQQYYPDSNTDSMRQMRNASGYYNYYSQSFQAASTYRVSQISLNMSKDAGHTGNFTCLLYGASGTHGTDAYPNGTLLSTSNSLTSEITSTPALVNFTFPNTYTVQDGNNYTIVVHTDQPSGNNGYVGADLTSPTDPGNFASHLYVDSWGTWSPSTSRDMIYYIYSIPVEYHLMQSYPDSHSDARRSMRDASGYNNYYSQSFTAISSYDVSRVRLNMSKDAGHTGNFTCYIYETLGTSGTDAYPSSTLLGTSDSLTTEITSTPQLVNFTFATVAGVTEGSDYAIVIYTDQPGSANGYVGADISSPSAEGNYAQHLYGNSWSTWSPSTTRDLIYYLYGAAAAPGTPVITGYSPMGAIYPEVQDAQTFEITVDQNTVCRWYINGSLKETDASSSTHNYTNSSLHGGVWNVTAVANNTYGADSQTWIFEVGADSITFIVLQDQPTNRTKIAEFEVTRIGSNVTQWSHNQSFTFNDWKYVFRFTNNTEIVNHTATYTNQTLLFNRTPMLPPGTYYLNVQGMVLTAAANQYFMFNNWTASRTFSQIAANEDNDIVYTWYNHTSGLYESYFVGRSYNANAIVPANCSVFAFFAAETEIDVTPRI